VPDTRLGPMLELAREEEGAGNTIRAVFNLGEQPQELRDIDGAGTTMLFSSEHSAYGGRRDSLADGATLEPFECVVFGPDQWASFPTETLA
jgi:hypothetical protein